MSVVVQFQCYLLCSKRKLGKTSDAMGQQTAIAVQAPHRFGNTASCAMILKRLGDADIFRPFALSLFAL